MCCEFVEHRRIYNPFDPAAVLWLAGLIVIIMLAAKGLAGRLGQGGVWLLAAASGIVDVDALTLSMARLAGTEIGGTEAATAIVIAAEVNTGSKAVMALAIGGKRFGTMVGAISLVAVGAMGLGLWVSHSL